MSLFRSPHMPEKALNPSLSQTPSSLQHFLLAPASTQPCARLMCGGAGRGGTCPKHQAPGPYQSAWPTTSNSTNQYSSALASIIEQKSKRTRAKEDRSRDAAKVDETFRFSSICRFQRARRIKSQVVQKINSKCRVS